MWIQGFVSGGGGGGGGYYVPEHNRPAILNNSKSFGCSSYLLSFQVPKS